MNKLKLLADTVPTVMGQVTPPIGTPTFTSPEEGLVKMLNVALQAVLIVAGIFTLINFILAGYSYISANGDPKKVAQANLKMTYTAIGLVIIVLTPLLAAIIGITVFGRWDAILNPQFTKI